MFNLNSNLATIKKSRDAAELISKSEFANRVKELKHCKDDINYFAETYFRIISLKDGLTIIKPYPKQKKLLEFIKNTKRVICLSSRQSGKCVVKDTEIKLRNKKTGEIFTTTIGDFFKNIEEKNK